MSFVKGKLTVKGTAFDRNLGGRDFDEVLVEKFITEFNAKYKFDLNSSAKAKFRLRTACEKVKKVCVCASLWLKLYLLLTLFPLD